MTETPDQKPAAAKKSSKLWWIIGCVGLFIIGVIILIVLIAFGIFSAAIVSQQQRNEAAREFKIQEEEYQRKMIEDAMKKAKENQEKEQKDSIY